MIKSTILKFSSQKSCVSYILRHYTNRNVLKLSERGLFQDIFPEEAVTQARDTLNTEPQCMYAGFDPTADSLHVGNLLVIIGLLQWQRAGHVPIALIGGATGQIGDPSGRTSKRSDISANDISINANNIQENIERIFRNHEEILWNRRGYKGKLAPLKVVNNESWYRGMDAIEFAGTVGRHFRMGTMLSRSSVQTRLKDAGMSFTEFTYQIFQAYDWLHLYQNYNCRFQLGGSDQMGNIMSGHELISRVTNKPVYGITMPLITSEEGDKFGKSSGNAVWLNEEKSSPFSLYQFFVRVKDSEVEQLLKLFTFDSLGEIEQLMSKHIKSPEHRIAQKKLADDVTLLVHGEKGLLKAQQTSAALYQRDVKSLGSLKIEELEELFKGANVVEILPSPGMNLMELALRAHCFPTEADAVRIIQAGGFYINHNRCTNIAEGLSPVHILPNNVTILRVGKRNYCIVKWLK
ncbi:tyrosine--tRNA ligase, mitochondrial-like [Ctenocephalides felis]|uniref:tyrosine--tRNA ligase, mitochondrial-like n=1 Tax=Ctenocephalides felis TaxID=7515 RepID=UPI000E6E5B31|nr:tyrosine--tRNA ligase, mitochondrial-like [Ctenocephalides felis]